MAKIGTFGTIRFKVSDRQLLTFQNFKREIAGSWSNMERIRKKPLTVFSGAELQTISFRIFLDAGLGIPPREVLEKSSIWWSLETPIILLSEISR